MGECGKKVKNDCRDCNYLNGKSFDLCTTLYRQCSEEKGSERRKFVVDRVSIWVKPKKCYDVYYLLDRLQAKVCKHWDGQSVKKKECNWQKKKEYKKKGDHIDDIYFIDNNPSVEWLACRILRELRKHYGGVVEVSVHTSCGYEAKAFAQYREHCHESSSESESYDSGCHPCKGGCDGK